jgi:inorganic pyrophosphatase
MKMVFITASPVLTNEVRRFYSTIKGKLLALLKARDEKIKQRKLEAKQQQESSQAQFEDITDQET